jgi:shikimate kinase
MNKRIILIGFMGSGKSYSGKILAQNYNHPFLDLDMEIQKKEKLSINDIFKNKGEKYFREIESEVLLNSEPNCVISTGGGIVESNVNRDFLKRPENYIIWLNPVWETLYSRIINSQRPLVMKLTEEELHELWMMRQKHYKECADICVEDVSQLEQ